jgi:3-oxoacyl-[acyl-carrier-protein] synthase II
MKEFRVGIGAMVPGYDKVEKGDNPCSEFALQAAREAWVHARLDEADVARERIGLVIGTSMGDVDFRYHGFTENVGDELGIEGPRLTISTACSSSTGALGLGLELLHEAADVVIAGGADLLTPWVFAGFHALGVMCPEKCSPFSVPPGMTLGEGAGFVVLESRELAARRRVPPLAVITGYGLSGDAHHETSPDPTGKGIARSITSTLLDAGLKPGAIDYVNAHGTGTANNDPAEWQGVLRALGEHARSVPISSTKSVLGHAQGAAGVLELIASIMAMQRGLVPQTLHFKGARPLCPGDPVAQSSPRKATCRHFLSLNAAFGGANAAVAVSHADTSGRSVSLRPVHLLGVGAIGPHGKALDDLQKSIDDGVPVLGPTRPYEIDMFVPTADPRGLDPATCHLTAAAALAVKDAGVKIRGDLRDRAGLIVGITRTSQACFDAFKHSVDTRGLGRVSATAFARVVLNAPAGSCSKLLSLRGPNTTLSTGDGSGLAAIICAAQILSSREDVELILAGGTDELPEKPARDETDGAAMVVLGASPQESAIEVAGWGVAGPGRLEDAIHQALAAAGVEPDAVQAIFSPDGRDGLNGNLKTIPCMDPTRVLGRAEAASAALASVIAAIAIREGRVDTALVTSARSRSMTAALILRGATHES